MGKTAGLKVVKQSSENDDRGRAAQLRRRQEALRRELTGAKERESEIDGALIAAKEDLAAGRAAVAGVRGAERALADHRAGIEHLAGALDSVESELREVEQRIAAVELEAERARQAKAVGPLRREAEALAAEFVENVAGIMAPLVRRQEIAARVTSEFPLAQAVEHLSVRRLAEQIRSAMGGHEREDLVPYVALVRRVLAGSTRIPTMNAREVGTPWMPLPAQLHREVQRRCGVED